MKFDKKSHVVLTVLAVTALTLTAIAVPRDATKVTFCDLYQNPARYSGKLIQLHAMIYGKKQMRIEDAGFQSSTCDSYFMIKFLIPANGTGDDAPIRDSSFEMLENGVNSGKRVSADLQGFFQFRERSDHKSEARLVLFKASNVLTLPVPRK